MPNRRPADEGQIIEEAGRWFARLHADGVPAADRDAFRAWLEADPRHAQAWEEMQAIADGVALAGLAAELAAAERTMPGRRWVPPVWAAAMLLLVIGVAAIWGRDLEASFRGDHVTGGAERRQVVLDDGSTMDLNVSSAVALSWTGEERRVELLRGEVFFKVVPDAGRPFVVASRHGEARVLGTAFSVRLAGDAARVTVEEGIVAVSSPSRQGVPLRLQGGQAVVVHDDTLGPVQAADLGVDTGWRTGRIAFRQRPLAEVVEVLDRYRPGVIVLLDRDLGQQRVTGAFDIGDTDKALTAIEKVMKLRIHRVTGYLTLISSQR